MFGEWTETDRQTATLTYEMSAVWEMKPRTTTQKALNGGRNWSLGIKAFNLYDDMMMTSDVEVTDVTGQFIYMQIFPNVTQTCLSYYNSSSYLMIQISS
jgi:hypothetical protein